MDLKDLLSRASDHLSVGRAFGNAYEREGSLIIPVALVAGGGGGGGTNEPTVQASTRFDRDVDDDDNLDIDGDDDDDDDDDVTMTMTTTTMRPTPREQMPTSIRSADRVVVSAAS